MSKKAVARTSGTVQKLLSSNFDGVSEKAEITVKGCDELYRELRIENALQPIRTIPSPLQPMALLAI
jgi:hypothetical protein